MDPNQQPVPPDLPEKLPAYWLDAKQVLEQGLPGLNIGEHEKQTVSSKGTIRVYFQGRMCKWASFTDEVLGLWNDESMVNTLERCANLPVAPDPRIQELNPKAMHSERIQCGGEITVSGRFYSNVLDPVIHCVETIAAAGEPAGLVPAEVTFGDAWIRDLRILKQYPDVIGKVQIGGSNLETRLIGEIKFPTTVKIAEMVRDALRGSSTDEFRAIMVVKYMLSHRLKYAFLTNYESTTCIQLSHSSTGDNVVMPQIAFSNTIDAGQVVDKKNISVRLALFYLVHKVFSEDKMDWQISDETAELAQSKDWLRATRVNDEPLGTPEGHRAEQLESGVDQQYKKPGIGVRPRFQLMNEQPPDSRASLETPSKPPVGHRSVSFLGDMQDSEDTPDRDPRRLISSDLRGETRVNEQKTSSAELQQTTDRLGNLSVSDEDSRPESDSSF